GRQCRLRRGCVRAFWEYREDRETGRLGDKEKHFLSPCLQVSLSPGLTLPFPSQPHYDREAMTKLHIQLHGATSYLQNPWSFGVNVSRCSLLLRKEIQRHLLMGRDELGFRHVRFHHLFDDQMKVLQEDGTFDFTVVEQAIDWLMEQGLTPFIGLSGLPAAL